MRLPKKIDLNYSNWKNCLAQTTLATSQFYTLVLQCSPPKSKKYGKLTDYFPIMKQIQTL